MPENHNCINCDEEFTVDSVYESQSDVMFCPFCGFELDSDDDLQDLDDIEDLDDYDGYRN